jgi:hypothetical protein
MAIAPTGAIVHDLRPGIEGAVIPPKPIWNAGKYFPELKKEAQEALEEWVAEKDRYNSWVVTGEYSPGNYIARIYILPNIEANQPDPDHPLDWSEWMRKGNSVTSHYADQRGGRGNGFGFGGFGSPPPAVARGASTETKPATPPPPAKPAVPMSIRIRCGGCGHWFKMDSLGSHAEYCCPGINGPESDWAMQCECCEELDQVQTLKPGFPRPKKVEPKKKEVKKSDADTSDAAAEPAGAGADAAAKAVASGD